MTTPSQNNEQSFDLDALFDSSGGGSGAPSFAWPADARNPRNPQIGGSIAGEITDVFVTVVKDAQTREPKLNKRGQQMPQVNVTIKTALRNWDGCKAVPVDPDTKQELPASEDTGERRIYVKYRMLDAVAKAIKSSEQGRGGPRVGAKLAVKLTALQDTGQLNPLPDYEARYEPPAADPAADVFNAAQTDGGLRAPAAADPWAGATGATSEPPF